MVYAPPDCFKKPEYPKYKSFEAYEKACNAYIEEIKQWTRECGTCPEAGEEITFPVADGRARYIIFSMKPVKLVHIDTADAYQFQYAHRLTASDIRKEIKKAKAINKLFGNKKMESKS
jgi:hypothetical protein